MRSFTTSSILPGVLLVLLGLLFASTLCSSAPGFDQQPTFPFRDFDLETRIDANLIDMYLTNIGTFAHEFGAPPHPGLTYPRGSGMTAVYRAGVWVGAKIVDETVPRVTVAEYWAEYSGGRIESDGSYDTDWGTNPRWRVYKIQPGDTPGSNPDYAEWPVEDGAPVDENGDPRHLGSQTCWTVFHDADPYQHTCDAGNSDPLGIEIQQTVFARHESVALQNIIFIEWKIVNKGIETLNSTFVSAWVDPDIGDAGDDLVGYDSLLTVGYSYNGDGYDEVYSTHPPALGIQLVQGPIVYSPEDEAYVSGQIIPDYRNLGPASFNKYINGTDPNSPLHSYNLMRGLNGDGTHVIDPQTGEYTTFQVPGDPVDGSGWIDTASSDRRMMLSVGPFDMAPGDSQVVAFAIVAGQGADHLDSITHLRASASQSESVFRAIYDGEVGACCYPDGSCSVLEEPACEGDFLVGEVCDPNPCEVTVGACCLLMGGCVVVAEEDCPDDYLGNGTTCDPDPCPESTAGACCIDYECTITRETDCPGFFQGAGTLCEPGVCSGVSWHWEPAPRWLSWIDWGGSTFHGGFGFGFEFFGSTLPREEVVSTEIRFDDDEANWSECQTYRRDLGYELGGIGTFPGSAWDISDPETPRRVNINFMEDDAPEKPANLAWDPDNSAMGGREYLFIMKSDYDGGASYGDGGELPDGMTSDVMFGGWTRVSGNYEFLEIVPAYLRFFVGTLEDPYGACCHFDGSCSITRRSECLWVFFGDGSDCVPNPCEVAEVRDDDRLSVLDEPFRAPYPNPAATDIVLYFELPAPAHVQIRIYNAMGARVSTLVDEDKAAGTHRVIWDARDDRGRKVTQGIYYARLIADGFAASRKIVLAR